MASSTFCLAPRGNAAWSPRLDEALHAGCIPVLLADSYDPPFSHVLDYSTFSFNVSEQHVLDGSVNLLRFLADVPQTKVRSMRAAGAAVRPFFRYRAFVEPQAESRHDTACDDDVDATLLLAFELWRRLRAK